MAARARAGSTPCWSIEALSAACAVTGRIAVETNMGAISAVMAYGSDEQKKLAADMVLSGDKPAICITEPEAGSDANGMTTRADKKGNRYVINGRKHWITGGGVSRLHLIFAKVFDEKGNEEGIGGFLAIRDETKGLKITKREPTMGLRGIPEAVIDFEDMELPPSALVLPPRGLKKGFADLMTAYNSQRVGAATVALGIAEGAYELALDWSEKRRPVRPADQRVPGPAMEARRHVDQARARRRRWSTTARARGEGGFPDMLLAAQAKVFASESAIQVVNDALQFFGARGYSRELPLERMARDVRMFTIGGGTAEVLRNVVAGALLEEEAAADARRLGQVACGALKRRAVLRSRSTATVRTSSRCRRCRASRRTPCPSCPVVARRAGDRDPGLVVPARRAALGIAGQREFRLRREAVAGAARG